MLTDGQTDGKLEVKVENIMHSPLVVGRGIQETHQKMRDPNVTSLHFATPLAFNGPDGEVSLGVDDLCKILHGGQRMAKVQNGEAILPKLSTPE